jgi:hypothetical protein
MNELDLIRDLGSQLDSEPITPPARMRSRFVGAITHPRRPAAGRRAPLLVAATAATAAIIAFTATQAGTPTPADTAADARPDRPGDSGADTPAETPPDTPGDAELDGRQVLLAAASSARSQRAQAPDPDAFIYTRLKRREWYWKTGASGSKDELWWPVNGTGGALHTFSDAEGGGTSLLCLPDTDPDAEYSRYMRPNPTAEHIAACEADPGYVTGLPDGPDAMLAYLKDNPNPARPGDAEFATVFSNAWRLLMWRMVEPQARATIFEALAGVPQLKVRRDVDTVDGETGTAVAYSPARRERFELIFDRETFELIGSRQIWLRRKKATNTWVDDWTGESAVVEQAVVPEMRQRPDGTKLTKKIDSLVHDELSSRPEFQD